MLIRQLLLIAAGASYGLLSAAGVFTVLVAVGAGVASRYDASRGQVTLFGQTLMLREADEGSGERSGADDEQAEHEAHAREERAEDVPHG